MSKKKNMQSGSKPSSSKRTQKEMIAYLDEHLSYERMMLKYAFFHIHTIPAGPAWNVMFESCCVHMRSLYEFLTNGVKTNGYNAKEFSSAGYKAPGENRFSKLNEFIFHMSAQRAQKKKLSIPELDFFGGWIDKHWAAWSSQVDLIFMPHIDANPVCSYVVLAAGVTNATACTVVTSATIDSITIGAPPQAAFMVATPPTANGTYTLIL